jgi:integrase
MLNVTKYIKKHIQKPINCGKIKMSQFLKRLKKIVHSLRGNYWVLVDLKNSIKDVQPIRTKEEIETMKWALKRFCGQRDYILFLLGINSGLRCGDLVKLQAKDLRRKKEFKIVEGKTKKPRTIYLMSVYEELNDYIDQLQSIWLFPSRKGNKPITVTQAYRQLNKASDMAQISHIGTHTMRKTFGYWHYRQFKDIAILQEILNHSHPRITKRYIGLKQEEIENTFKSFSL